MHMHMHTHKCRKRCLFEWSARAMQSCSVRVMTQRNCNGRKRVLQHTILLACREGANVVCCVHVYVCVCARACTRVCVCVLPISRLSRASSRARLRLVCVYIRVCICCHVHLRSDVQPLSLPSRPFRLPLFLPPSFPLSLQLPPFPRSLCCSLLLPHSRPPSPSAPAIWREKELHNLEQRLASSLARTRRKIILRVWRRYFARHVCHAGRSPCSRCRRAMLM